MVWSWVGPTKSVTKFILVMRERTHWPPRSQYTLTERKRDWGKQERWERIETPGDTSSWHRENTGVILSSAAHCHNRERDGTHTHTHILMKTHTHKLFDLQHIQAWTSLTVHTVWCPCYIQSLHAQTLQTNKSAENRQKVSQYTYSILTHIRKHTHALARCCMNLFSSKAHY